MSRTLLVDGKKVLRVTIPDDARVTFGPWSPPTGETKYGVNEKALSGTLRVYSKGTKATENILVRTVWKSDAKGYSQEVVGSVGAAWVYPVAELTAGDDEEEQF